MDTPLFSNASTGDVTFILPSGGTTHSVVVNASLPSGLSATHLIYLRSSLQTLDVEISPYPVDELSSFTVYVTSNDEPVEDVKVYFLNTIHSTNTSGMVTFTAPDVLVTSNYGLVVNKSGYEDATTFVSVYEAGVGDQLLELVVPSIVEPLSSVPVLCRGLNGGIEGVHLELWYEEELIGNYTTATNGKVTIETPFLDILNYCTLHVEKQGYATYDGEHEFDLWLVSRQETQSLMITSSSSETYEGLSLTLEITDGQGNPVNDAMIWSGPNDVGETTDSQGILIITAPQVFFDREYYFYALKEGYNFAQTTVTIRNILQDDQTLNLLVDEFVYETEAFLVTVTDFEGRRIADASVVFGSEEQRTSSQGVVSFTAPEVLTNTTLSLQASKYGFEPVSSSVYVVDLDGSSHTTLPSLVIYVADKVLEYEAFTITVKTQQGTMVSDANVWFMEQRKTTDALGQVTFTASEVAWDTQAEILVVKQGCTSASKQIIITNVSGFPYWMILVVVSVVLLVGCLSYFRYRRRPF